MIGDVATRIISWLIRTNHLPLWLVEHSGVRRSVCMAEVGGCISTNIKQRRIMHHDFSLVRTGDCGEAECGNLARQQLWPCPATAHSFIWCVLPL